MKYVYFKIRAVSPDTDAERLNVFLAAQSTSSVTGFDMDCKIRSDKSKACGALVGC